MQKLIQTTLAVGGLLLLNVATAEADRPNIVLMMSDDQGWGETGYNGHPHLKTPVLDQMAASGLRLDRFYAASPVCSPTRASVLTGRHANRCGAFGAGWSIRPEEITLAPILKAAGYRTAHFGKWHVGAVKKDSPLSPIRLGFEESLSHDNFFEMNPELSRNGRSAERKQGESSEILVAAALDFASRTLREDHPFFIMIWFGSPHAPYEASEVDRAPYKHLGEELSHRLGEIAAMDRAIGMFRRGLDELGARNSTLLWFNSDNGITKEGIPREQQAELFRGIGLRGNKSQMYEGGLRVPGIIEWPAVISAARSSTVPCVTSDILPTLLDILGITHPEPHRPLDGVSLKTLIVDGTMKTRPAPIGFWGYDRSSEENNERWISDNSLSEIITLTAVQKATLRKRPDATWHFRNHKHPVRRTSFAGPAAWIDGRYKLVMGRGDQSQQVELYDLEADRGEANNIASQHPDKVGAMTRQLRDWQQSVENSLTGADYTSRPPAVQQKAQDGTRSMEVIDVPQDKELIEMSRGASLLLRLHTPTKKYLPLFKFLSSIEEGELRCSITDLSRDPRDGRLDPNVDAPLLLYQFHASHELADGKHRPIHERKSGLVLVHAKTGSCIDFIVGRGYRAEHRSSVADQKTEWETEYQQQDGAKVRFRILPSGFQKIVPEEKNE